MIASSIEFKYKWCILMKKLRSILRNNRYVYGLYMFIKTLFKGLEVGIPEITTIKYKHDNQLGVNYRINLLIPTLNERYLFGGIATAVSFLKKFADFNLNIRIIITDTYTDETVKNNFTDFNIIDCKNDSNYSRLITTIADKKNSVLSVGQNDIFMASAWWTAYIAKSITKWQSSEYNCKEHNIIYLIQDYEPNFYPWSTRYMLAESTYRYENLIAIFNTSILMEYFKNHNYSMTNEYFFEPRLNENLKKYLDSHKNTSQRKKQILIYGRPSVARNAFEIIVLGLKKWTESYDRACEWQIISLGEQHAEVKLANGVVIKSLGKVSLEQYSKIMLESYLGISLMVSPHPSYPPLEMAQFGMKVITNSYSNKNLSKYSDNITSISTLDDNAIAESIQNNIEKYISHTAKYEKITFGNNDSANFDVIANNIMNTYNIK